MVAGQGDRDSGAAGRCSDLMSAGRLNLSGRVSTGEWRLAVEGDLALVRLRHEHATRTGGRRRGREQVNDGRQKVAETTRKAEQRGRDFLPIYCCCVLPIGLLSAKTFNWALACGLWAAGGCGILDIGGCK